MGGCGLLGPVTQCSPQHTYSVRHVSLTSLQYRITLDVVTGRIFNVAPGSALIMPSCHALNVACREHFDQSMLLDCLHSQYQNRRLVALCVLGGRTLTFTSLPRVAVASVLSSMSSFLLQSLISEGSTFRVTTGLSLMMAPARHRYVRLEGKEGRRGEEGKRNAVMLKAPLG